MSVLYLRSKANDFMSDTCKNIMEKVKESVILRSKAMTNRETDIKIDIR